MAGLRLTLTMTWTITVNEGGRQDMGCRAMLCQDVRRPILYPRDVDHELSLGFCVSGLSGFLEGRWLGPMAKYIC